MDRDENNRPLSVTVRADRVGNDESILFDLRSFLIQRVEQRVREYYPVFADRILPYVRGILTVTNHGTGTTRAATQEAISRNFRDIRIQDMEDLEALLSVSDERLDQLNLEWTFQIIWPEGLGTLVGAKVRPPSGYFESKNDPWMRLWNTPDDLSCLAYSLVHLMDSNRKHLFDTKTRDGLETARRKTLRLMEEMEWNKYVNIYEGCAQFVTEYDEYQLVVLTALSLKTKAQKVFTGSRFVPRPPGSDGKYNKKNNKQ